jgi:hypothetical protein
VSGSNHGIVIGCCKLTQQSKLHILITQHTGVGCFPTLVASYKRIDDFFLKLVLGRQHMVFNF